MSSLSFPFSSGLGGDDIGLPDETIPATEDHIQAALDRLALQFQDRPNFVQLLTELAVQCNGLEIVYGEQFPLLPVIATGTGIQLDVIGRIVGEPRGGFDDPTYRLHLVAKIYLNRSSGTPDQIYALFTALLGSIDGLSLTEEPPAAFTIHANGAALDQTTADYLLQILHRAKGAGIDARLNWSTVPGSETFTFLGGPGLGFENGIWSTTE